MHPSKEYTEIVIGHHIKHRDRILLCLLIVLFIRKLIEKQTRANLGITIKAWEIFRQHCKKLI